MSSENFEEILQLKEHEVASNPNASSSKRRRIYKQQRPIPHVIELESDFNTSGQQKFKEKSTKIDLNKITDQLVLISNAKPPGQSWIWGYFDQYKPVGQYKRVVRYLV